jgi:UTP--glucose-1-phosphate uridylyltransferase
MPQRIRHAVLPAAGLGARLLPATKAVPKEMLPLVDKPLIQYVVEEAAASGIESLIVVTSRGKSAIENHFDLAIEVENLFKDREREDLLREIRSTSKLAKISYLRQLDLLGLGHAVLQARHLVEGEPFAVMLPDDIIDAERPMLKQMLEVYERFDAPVLCTMEVKGAAISRFGVLDAEKIDENVYQVRDMVEKPPLAEAPSDLAIIGRYIFTPDILDALERTEPGLGDEIQITDAMRLLVKQRPFYAVRLQGMRFDVGDKLGFLIATVNLALKRPDLAPEFAEHLRSLKLT